MGAWGESPRATVERLYADWTAIRPCASEVEVQFFQRHRSRFQLVLYEQLLQAYGYRDPMWPGSDLLLGGQVACYGYQVMPERITAQGAEVDVFVRLGLDRRRSRVCGRRVRLEKSTSGWQVCNILGDSGSLVQEVEAYLDYRGKSPL